MIWVVTVHRPGDAKPCAWYFDDVFEWRKVTDSLKTMGIKFTSQEDYLTSADEFRAWWRHEGE